MPLSKLLLLFVFMAPLAFSPGPNNMLCATLGSRFGFRSTIPFIVGMNTTVLIATFVVGFFFSRILDGNQAVFNIIKYVGASVLLLIALRLLVSANQNSEDAKKTYLPGYLEGMILNLLNPKAIMLLVIMYSQFYDPAKQPIIQILVITLTTLIISVASHFVWTAGGNYLRSRLGKANLGKVQNIFIVLIILVIPVLLFVL